MQCGRLSRVWLVFPLLGGLLLGCDAATGHASTRYFWHKPQLEKPQAFKDVIFCMDLSDAAFQRSNGNRGPVYGQGLIGGLTAVGVQLASTNHAMQYALTAYDQCMHDRGYMARKLSSGHFKTLSQLRSSIEVAEVLSSIMEEPLNPESVRISIGETRVSLKPKR